ncbi:hypothetical protein [Kamptonema formosum]|uniref:hypothetical protein n=1 Tax=Kamptonema formosum TaxID=331992 RepID=UPI000344ECCD|nr:hypothetical protein [Oscillatoria sp. PCC 10802]
MCGKYLWRTRPYRVPADILNKPAPAPLKVYKKPAGSRQFTRRISPPASQIL